MIRALLVCLVTAATAAPSLGWAAFTPLSEGRIELWSQHGQPVEQLTELVNLPGRVYAYTFHFGRGPNIEHFYFEGDGKQLNEFLDRYTRLPHDNLPLTIHAGPAPPISGPAWASEEYPDKPYDWILVRIGQVMEGAADQLRLEVWLGGGLDTAELNLAAGKKAALPVDANWEMFGNADAASASSEMEPRFGIYLLKDESLTGPQALEKELSSLELRSEPLIGADDILGWDWEKQFIALTDDAIKRLPDPGVRGIPFVMVAGGRPQYLGAFWKLISSLSFSEPVIEVMLPNPAYNIPGGRIYPLQRAYPGPVAGKELPDPRMNDTVLRCLRSLGKLKTLPKPPDGGFRQSDPTGRPTEG